LPRGFFCKINNLTNVLNIRKVVLLCYTIIMIPQNLAEILEELRHSLNDVMGSRITGLYLYGSYARGEARPDSDIDILVVVKAPFDYGDLIRLTSTAVADISLKHDVVISRVFLSENDFRKSQDLFARNIRREMVAI